MRITNFDQVEAILKDSFGSVQKDMKLLKKRISSPEANHIKKLQEEIDNLYLVYEEQVSPVAEAMRRIDVLREEMDLRVAQIVEEKMREREEEYQLMVEKISEQIQQLRETKSLPEEQYRSKYDTILNSIQSDLEEHSTVESIETEKAEPAPEKFSSETGKLVTEINHEAEKF